MPETHDLSTKGNPNTLRRIVRPFCNIGPAIGGDEVILDATELDHPAVAETVWTAEELAETQRQAEEAKRARAATQGDPVARRVDAQMKKAIAERAAVKKKQAVEDVIEAELRKKLAAEG